MFMRLAQTVLQLKTGARGDVYRLAQTVLEMKLSVLFQTQNTVSAPRRCEVNS